MQPMTVDQAMAHLNRNSGKKAKRVNDTLPKQVKSVNKANSGERKGKSAQNDKKSAPEPVVVPPRRYFDYIPVGEFEKRIVFYRGEKKIESWSHRIITSVYAYARYVINPIVYFNGFVFALFPLGIGQPLLLVITLWCYYKLCVKFYRYCNPCRLINIPTESACQFLRSSGAELLQGEYDSEELVVISKLVYNELRNTVGASNLSSSSSYQRCLVQVNRMMMDDKLPHLKDSPNRYNMVNDTIIVFLQDVSIERARISNRMPVSFGITTDNLSN